MRVAALYDVHGNVCALEAVLADAGEVEAYLFGGDVFWGPWAGETLEVVRSLGERALFVRGNWERYLLEGKDEWTAPSVSPDVVREWPLTLTLDGVVYCHATPARDDDIVLPQLERSDWSAFTAPLTVCGHTHVQFAIDRIVNPGSVGLPTVRAVAWWALVENGDVEPRTTEYDTAATAEAMRRSKMPEVGELADEVLRPPTVEQLLERIG